MQRKTNLFYSKGQDSNFLTFSNFTEALTGNFLSTDWKIYPSRFFCLYIPKLDPNNENYNESNKETFIKDNLVAYYENKLAFLRDYYTSQNSSVESYDLEGDIDSLAWLFKTIFDFDENTEITFKGEVTEFDYKGTYTDAICIIDASEGYYEETNHITKYTADITATENIVYDQSPEILYNWSDSELNINSEEVESPYADVDPIFDDYSDEQPIYTRDTFTLTTEEGDSNILKFNVIIPLFDITDIYVGTNSTVIDENTDLFNEQGELVAKERKSINNPMGIWFSDELIELKRDKESKYAPSWSLTISSQFKPLPYSNAYHNNDITQKDNEQAFQTYAKVLAQQSLLNSELQNISTRLTKIEQLVTKLNNLNNNELIQELHNFKLVKDNVENEINAIDSKIADKVAEEISKYEYKWK